MELTMAEKLRIIMKRQGITLAELAERTGQSRQNLSNKMTRDNFSDREIRAMAAALGCTVSTTFTMQDGTVI